MHSIHDRRVPPAGSPSDIYPKLMSKRLYLDALRQHHLQLVNRFLSADGGNIYTLDVFLTGVATRSYHLVDGFLDLYDQWNVISAAPILRLQLDNLTRVCYVSRAVRADEIATDVVKGVEFRRMKSDQGERLTDRFLVNTSAEHHKWLPPVYEATSGWVHLSPVHTHIPWTVAADEVGDSHRLEGRFPLHHERIPESALAEILGAMTQATEELFGYFESWESRKGSPVGKPGAGRPRPPPTRTEPQ